MIGKGRFFDLITQTANDANNPGVNIPTMLKNFNIREEKIFFNGRNEEATNIER